MIERRSTHNSEEANKTGERYLRNLGLTWDELKGTKMLDIGALHAEFEHAARKHGVDVISVDKKIEEGEFSPPTDSKFVVANATTLPFNDGSFKYAVAHMSAMNYKEEKYSDEEYLTYVEDVLKEVARVLEPDGQFRFTDTAISDEDLRHGENDKIPEKSNEYTEWRMEREYRVLKEMAERAGFRELRVEKYSDSHPEKDEYLLTHYYVALR